MSNEQNAHTDCHDYYLFRDAKNNLQKFKGISDGGRENYLLPIATAHDDSLSKLY